MTIVKLWPELPPFFSVAIATAFKNYYYRMAKIMHEAECYSGLYEGEVEHINSVWPSFLIIKFI